MKNLAREAGTYSSTIEVLNEQFPKIRGNGRVGKIFIRLTKHQIPSWMQTLSPLIVPVHCWTQSAMVLYLEGVLEWDSVRSVALEEGLEISEAANLIQDLQRRSLITPDQSTNLYQKLGLSRYVFPFDFKELSPTYEMVSQAFRSLS